MIWTQCSRFAMRRSLVFGRLSASYSDVLWRNTTCSARNFASSTKATSSKDNTRDAAGGPGTKATEEQLVHIKNKMTESFSKVLHVTHNFDDYHPNLIFEDNIRNVRSSGIFNYYLQILQTRAFCLIRYTSSTVKVLKATHDTQDSKVCIRWTFEGRFLLKFFRQMIGARFNKNKVTPCRIIDGFSIMYVGDDGLVWKHVIEKMIPDPDSFLSTDSAESIITPKIGDATVALNRKP